MSGGTERPGAPPGDGGPVFENGPAGPTRDRCSQAGRDDGEPSGARSSEQRPGLRTIGRWIVQRRGFAQRGLFAQ